MISVQFFVARKILYAVPDFLSWDECVAIRQEMDSVSTIDAGVYESDHGKHMSKQIRKTKICGVSAKTEAQIKQRLMARQEEIEKSFSLKLGRLERPQFLKYLPGDYFKPHQDHLTPDGMPERLITFVLFLNVQIPEKEPFLDPLAYQGGELVLYSLSGRLPGMVGFPLKSEPGMLIAFRSELVHEVRPVSQGNRYTVINFYSA